MKEIYDKPCPLCGSPAHYSFVDRGNRKYFTCKQCVVFQISNHAEKSLMEAPQQLRDGLAKKSKTCGEGKALVILFQISDQSISAECCDRATLPRS